MAIDNKDSQLLGGILGLFIGLATGGVGFSLVGAVFNGVAVGALFGNTNLPDGPRLEDVSVNVSTYGVMIPRLYGRDLLTSNIIWMKGNELQEVSKRVKYKTGIFSSSTRTEYSYYASFAVGLCEGTIDYVSKIWANDELIFERSESIISSVGSPINVDQNKSKPSTAIVKTGSSVLPFLITEPTVPQDTLDIIEKTKDQEDISTSSLNIRVYKGTLTQDIDPIILEDQGDEATAFRGIAYVVFDKLMLTNEEYRNSIPTLKFEVVKNGIKKITSLDDINNEDLPSPEAEPDFRNFAQSYQALSTDGTSTQGVSTTFIRTSMGGLGSAYYNGLNYSTSSTGRGMSQVYDNYANDGHLVYSMHHQGAYTTFYNYTYTAGLTKVTYLNVRTPTYAFQVHDTSNLSAAPSGQNLPESSSVYREATTLMREQYIPLHPSDMQDTKIWNPSSPSIPTVKAVQNLAGWVIVLRGGTLHVGNITSGRFVLWNTRLNLADSEFSTRTFNVNSYTAGSKAGYTTNRVQAFYAEGFIYIYCKPPTQSIMSSDYDYFSGIIRLEVSGLKGSQGTSGYMSSKNSIYGTNFSSDNTKNYIVTDTTNFRFMNQGSVKWLKDFCVSTLAYDYETKRLYALNDSTEDRSDFLSSGFALDSQESNRLYLIDNNLNINQELLLYKSNKRVIGSYTDKYGISVARVYENSYLDYGDVLYKLAGSVEGSYFTISNSNSYIDNDVQYSQSSYQGGADRLIDPSPNDSARSGVIRLLPITSSSESEKQNIFTFAGYVSSTNSNRDFPYIQKSLSIIGADKVELSVITESGTNYYDSTTIRDIFESELARTSKVSIAEDTDISGLDRSVIGISIKDSGSIKDIMKGLQDAYLFDITEEDYKIKGKLRADSDVIRTISSEELGAKGSGSQGIEDIKINIPAKTNTPNRYNVTYRSAEDLYEPATVSWVDDNSEGEVSLDIKIPIVLTDDDAYNITQRVFLAVISTRRGSIELTTSFKHSDLELNDFIQVLTKDGESYVVRIVAIDKGRPSLVKISAVIDSPQNYSFSKGGLSQENVQDRELSKIANLVVVDSLPFRSEEDTIAPWLGAYSSNGSEAFTSLLDIRDDSGTLINEGFGISNATPVALVQSILTQAQTEGDFDYRQNIIFKPISSVKYYPSLTEEEVLSDETVNTFFYGREGSWEIIKILNFIDNGDGTITGSGILRGYKGTSHHSQHNIGDYLVAYGLKTLGKPVLVDKEIGDFVDITLIDPSTATDAGYSDTLKGEGRLPLPPVKLGGYRKTNGDFYIEWFRQARHTIEWVNSYDVPLDEATEEYKVLIVDTDNDNLIVDEFVVQDVTNFNYDVSLQTNAFGSPVSELSFVVLQYSQELDKYGHPSELTTI